MEKINILNNKSFKRFAFVYSLIVFAYLLIRAFLNEYLADETASFWYFVSSGKIMGEDIVLDAANHPLNSFLGHISYLVFGDIRGFIRIWSVLSYILYAYFSYKLCLSYRRKSLQYLGFVALNSIPYMLEYFAYSRGYGLSMGFFMAAVYFLLQFVYSPSSKNLLFMYCMILLGFSANLTLLNSVLLCFALALFLQFYQGKQFSKKQHFQFGFLHLGLLLCLVPFIQFSFRLKAAGALYYSTLDGIWDMTGRTLSAYVFFYSSWPLMYVLLLFLLLNLYFLAQLLKKVGFSKWMQSPKTLIAYLFFGNMLAAILLALLLKINYPSDRTGMYFIPLFLFLLFDLMERIKWTEFLLLFFPLSLVLHLSIHSSVFSPDDRLTNKFFDAVYQKIKKDDTIVIYKTMFANWNYLCSTKKNKFSMGQAHMESTKYADIFLSKVDRQQDPKYRNPNLHLYHLIAKDDDAHFLAYKRNKTAVRMLVFEKKIPFASTKDEFLEFLNESDLKSISKNHNLVVSISGYMDVPKGNKSDLVLTTSKENNDLVRYLNDVWELKYLGKAIHQSFKVNYLLENVQANEVKLKLYLWNRNKGLQHFFKNIEIRIYEIY